MSTDRYVRSFASPDDLIEMDTVRSATISKGGLTVSHDLHRPGWRWSVHVRPLVHTDWCEIHHIGVILRGRMQFLLDDGTELEAGPTSLVDIPPRHDAWVAGDDPVEMITWTGARGWLAPLETLGERVLATVVFTDVVGSTEIAERMGDAAWADHVATLESRSRDIAARFRGRVVKTMGDGILATFDGAARALRCAVVLRDAAVDLGLQLRLAVHTGEVEVAEDDLRGLVVHEASRMLGLSANGEIVVSATTAGLVTDRDFALEDRGEHELRGIAGARRILALR